MGSISREVNTNVHDVSVEAATFTMREIMQVIAEQFGLDTWVDNDDITAAVQKALDRQGRDLANQKENND